jgi:hypothetical protein
MVNKWDNVKGLVQHYFEKELKDWSDEQLAVLQDAMDAALYDIILCDAYLINSSDLKPIEPPRPRFATVAELSEYKRVSAAYEFDLERYRDVVIPLERERSQARDFLYGIYNRTGFDTFSLSPFGCVYCYNVYNHCYEMVRDEN